MTDELANVLDPTPQPSPADPLPRPRLMLPRNLHHLAKVTTEEAGRKYATHAVRLCSTRHGYEASATNGTCLIRVTGPQPADPEACPALTSMGLAFDPIAEALIPAKDWRQALRMVCRGRRLSPLTHTAAVALHRPATLHPGQATFATAADGHTRTHSAECAPGKHPDAAAIIPQDAPLATIDVNPRLLAHLLRVLSHFAEDDYCTSPRVTIEVRGSETALVLRCKRGAQQTLALLCGLSPPMKTP